MAAQVSSTFHGRDIFAPAAANLSLGMSLADLGPEINDPIINHGNGPVTTPDGITGEIIHVDRFGNLITDLTPEHLPNNFDLAIAGRSIKTLRRTYAEAERDELFLIRGSRGFMEICLREASAADRLKVSVGEVILVNTIPDGR